jgi:hypothetical protein
MPIAMTTVDQYLIEQKSDIAGKECYGKIFPIIMSHGPHDQIHDVSDPNSPTQHSYVTHPSRQKLFTSTNKHLVTDYKEQFH